MIYVLSGGGAGLNLKVVGGTTQPTGPAENTVWVNTDTEISGWAFSAAQPTSPVEGMVWFSTGTDSPAAMNVAKKNTVTLYPIGCKQYVGAKWVSKVAKTWQNGAWIDWWDGQFLGDGNQYEYITGGWEAVAWQEGPQSYNAQKPSLSFGSTGTTVTFQSESGGVFINKAKVNLSNYNTLKVRLDFKTALDGNIHLQVRTNNYKEQSYWRVDSTGVLASYDLFDGHAAENNVVWTLDISKVSAPCYILIGHEAYSQTKIVIHDIWAE